MNNKYNPGDKITCEFVVSKFPPYEEGRKGDKVFIEGPVIWVPEESIIKHEPKPWTPEIGEKVSDKKTKHIYEVKGVHEDQLWVLSPSGCLFTSPLSTFSKVI